MVKIAPSVLACDFARLGEEAAAMVRAGAEWIHLDVMDGHFVPNLSFGAPVIAGLCRSVDLQADVHLMVTNPLDYVEDCVKAGADHISFHIESDSPVVETIERIRSHGVGAGLVVKPGTSAEAVLPYLDKLRMVLVMTVEPGFGGQSFQPEMLPKIAAIRRYCEEKGLQVDLQVDGGIDNSTAPEVVRHGANVLVAGSSLFSQVDYYKAVRDLRRAAENSGAPCW